MSIDTPTQHGPATVTDTLPRVASGCAAALALVPLALCSFSGDTGAEITASLVGDAAMLQVGAGVAVLAGALLLVAAVRLAAAIPGAAGRVAGTAGAAVAVLFVAYYASFGAGAVVVGSMLSDPGPGVGEGTALLVNMTEVVRYAPGLALTAATVLARRHLPAGVWVTGAVLALLTLVPFTSWVAALAIPLWLGISAATLGARRPAVPR